MLIHIHRIRPKKLKISEPEFKLTQQLMYIFDIYPNENYELYIDKDYYSVPLSDIRSKPLAFAERYTSIENIPKEMSIFRPFKSDKHADLIIKLFEDSNIIEYDSLEIMEYHHNGKTKYSGYLLYEGKKIEGSHIKTSPSIPILKMSIIASLLMDENEHKEYMTNLYSMLNKKSRESDV